MVYYWISVILYSLIDSPCHIQISQLMISESAITGIISGHCSYYHLSHLFQLKTQIPLSHLSPRGTTLHRGNLGPEQTGIMNLATTDAYLHHYHHNVIDDKAKLSIISYFSYYCCHMIAKVETCSRMNSNPYLLSYAQAQIRDYSISSCNHNLGCLRCPTLNSKLLT